MDKLYLYQLTLLQPKLPMSEFDFLVSSQGSHILEQLANENLGDSLAILTRLRKTLSREQASAVLSQVRLRQKAVDKFGADAARMFFTDTALQQASDPLIRHYRATHVSGQSGLDLCCGIGSDTMAFGAIGANVLGIDIDPTKIEIARYNTNVLDIDNAHFQVGDATEYESGSIDFVFFDPARRDASGRRIHHVADYIPPLSTVYRYDAQQIIVKLSPGVDLSELERYPGLVEFISVDGDLKEALLWLNHTGRRRATRLQDKKVMHWEADLQPNVAIGEPQAWLVEPDPALIRAGMVQAAAEQFDGMMLDETIAYFTTQHKPQSDWVRAWEILDWMPFNLKKMRAYLRDRNVGHVTVKKRGSPLTPDELIRKLKLKGEHSCTLILSRYAGQPIVMICADYAP